METEVKPDIPVDEVQVRQVEVQKSIYLITVKQNSGVFKAYKLSEEAPKEVGSNRSMDLLMEELKKREQRKRAKISVPFTTENGRHGTLTGRHASNSKWLVKWDDGETEQITYVYNFLPRLTSDEKQELLRLVEENRKTSAALYSFRNAQGRKGKIDKLVREEWRKAAGEDVY